MLKYTEEFAETPNLRPVVNASRNGQLVDVGHDQVAPMPYVRDEAFPVPLWVKLFLADTLALCLYSMVDFGGALQESIALARAERADRTGHSAEAVQQFEPFCSGIPTSWRLYASPASPIIMPGNMGRHCRRSAGLAGHKLGKSQVAEINAAIAGMRAARTNSKSVSETKPRFDPQRGDSSLAHGCEEHVAAGQGVRIRRRKIFVVPLVGLIYVLSLASFFWADLIYGIGLVIGVPTLLVQFLA